MNDTFVNAHLGATSPEILHGIAASPGIAIARVLHIDRKKNPIRHYSLPEEGVESEVRRFAEVVEQVRQELALIRKELADRLQDYSSIIDSHILILQDSTLFHRTIGIIRSDKVNAEWALERTLEHTRMVFSQIGDSYIRARFYDVEQVTDRLLALLSGARLGKLAEVNGRAIVVAHDFSPADASQMRPEKVLGFLTDMGGKTSHTAIVARAFGIPAVVGLECVTDKVFSGDLVILDGIAGRVIVHPTPDQVEHYVEYQRQYQRYNAELAVFAHLPSETKDGLRVEIKANIEMVQEVPSALEYGARGVGLYRSEYLYIGREELPDEEVLFSVYRDLLSQLAPLPVTIRTLDVGGDKLGPLFNNSREMNPALGVRAIRFSLYEQDIFEVQLRALFRASVHGNLRIMFPMISGVREVVMVQEIVDKVKNALRQEHIPFVEDVPLGILIEVPSAVAMADILAKKVDFFSIGTNDLIQYALAIDRGNEQVAYMYEPLHPAVLRMIKQVVDAGHDNGIEVGLCGEMAGDPAYLPVLLGLGIDELSLNPLSIPCIKRMVRNSMAEKVEELAGDLLTCSTVAEVKKRLFDYLPSHYPEEFGQEAAIHAGASMRFRK